MYNRLFKNPDPIDPKINNRSRFGSTKYHGALSTANVADGAKLPIAVTFALVALRYDVART